MTAPYPSDAHVDSALSTFISSYTNGDYFADIVCPVIETEKSSGKFQQYSRPDFARERDLVMAATGQATELGYTLTTGDYACIDYAGVDYVPLKLLSDADEPQRPLERSSSLIMNALLLERERRVATLLTTSGNWATANTGAVSNYWSDGTAGTPLDDILDGLNAIAPGMSGDMRKVFICSAEVFADLRKHPQMLAGGSQKPVLSPGEVADLIGVDEVLVSEAQSTSTNRGQTASYSRIWGSTSAVAVCVPRGEPRGEAGLAAATFRHTLEGESPIQVRRWYEAGRGRGGSEAVQVEHSDDEVMVQNDMGYLWTSVRS